MNRAEKLESTNELRDNFAKANAIFTADYRGITVADITLLRFELKKSKTDLKVVKNRLALRALDQKDYGNFKSQFDYMTAVALNYGDPAAAAKSLTKFASDNDKLKLKGAFLDGKVISIAEVKALSKLPSKNELLAKLLGTLNAVPTGFVRVLNGVPAKWVYLLQAIKNQKDQKG
ncbi:MAG: 50S ribosomal protein L10 [Deltaproteobacteria bacterium]|nr:50S ribosomal protein L10 [Deltaproteobacteria bacterium]